VTDSLAIAVEVKVSATPYVSLLDSVAVQVPAASTTGVVAHALLTAFWQLLLGGCWNCSAL
jgi:hypothetical protein